MYQIENKSDIFVEHYVGRFRRTYKIDRIGTEKKSDCVSCKRV